ncbi:hypothetical protein PGTUg99_028718 [Puccinia graminis f. sp. tritici]|uniref:Uncharacterized protein n=1 Tax=Puccinia graminis f. sp. tritici TaxID=56615 RepID=A0A5B0RZI0_PUCGR|nr:hypothetical protein PGTUg99_028718 [Puccinia graminis f. sp. tritici]
MGGSCQLQAPQSTQAEAITTLDKQHEQFIYLNHPGASRNLGRLPRKQSESPIRHRQAAKFGQQIAGVFGLQSNEKGEDKRPYSLSGQTPPVKEYHNNHKAPENHEAPESSAMAPRINRYSV